MQDTNMKIRRREGDAEAIIDPAIPIINSHIHLFDRPALRNMLEDYLADATTGHNIVGSVYIEIQAMARPDGPEMLRPTGEIEFANGVAAMSASGLYGRCRVAAAIVGYADFRCGEKVAQTLDRAMSIAPDRFRGIARSPCFIRAKPPTASSPTALPRASWKARVFDPASKSSSGVAFVRRRSFSSSDSPY